MAKYTDADCRLCRREGCKLFLKGDRCVSSKCAMEKRPVLPGQHGAERKKVTDYGVQLREKQKVKRAYGLLEKQFRAYYEEAERVTGVTGENMLSLLERRLDNVVYRMGVGSSRSESRQIVSHRHVTVNGKIVNIPSYQVKVGDVIAVKENSLEHGAIKEAVEACTSRPAFVDFDKNKMSGTYLRLPDRSELNQEVNETLIVEFYNR